MWRKIYPCLSVLALLSGFFGASSLALGGSTERFELIDPPKVSGANVYKEASHSISMFGQSTLYTWDTELEVRGFFASLLHAAFGGRGEMHFTLEVIQPDGSRKQWNSQPPGSPTRMGRLARGIRQPGRWLRQQLALWRLPAGSANFPLDLVALATELRRQGTWLIKPFLHDENTIGIRWDLSGNVTSGQPPAPPPVNLYYSIRTGMLVDAGPPSPESNLLRHVQNTRTPDGQHRWTLKEDQLTLSRISDGEILRQITLATPESLPGLRQWRDLLALVAGPNPQSISDKIVLLPRLPSHFNNEEPPVYFEVDSRSGAIAAKSMGELPGLEGVQLAALRSSASDTYSLKIVGGKSAGQSLAYYYRSTGQELEIVELTIQASRITGARAIRSPIPGWVSSDRIAFLPEAGLVVLSSGSENAGRIHVVNLADGRLLNSIYPYTLDGSPRASVYVIRGAGTQLSIQMSYNHTEYDDDGQVVGSTHPNAEFLEAEFSDSAWNLSRPKNRLFRLAGTRTELRALLAGDAGFEAPAPALTPAEIAAPPLLPLLRISFTGATPLPRDQERLTRALGPKLGYETLEFLIRQELEGQLHAMQSFRADALRFLGEVPKRIAVRVLNQSVANALQRSAGRGRQMLGDVVERFFRGSLDTEVRYELDIAGEIGGKRLRATPPDQPLVVTYRRGIWNIENPAVLENFYQGFSELEERRLQALFSTWVNDQIDQNPARVLELLNSLGNERDAFLISLEPETRQRLENVGRMSAARALPAAETLIACDDVLLGMRPEREKVPVKKR